jgi:catalase (peroxidase I)
MDESEEQTDLDSFARLEPVADGFPNYKHPQPYKAREQVIPQKEALSHSFSAAVFVRLSWFVVPGP